MADENVSDNDSCDADDEDDDSIGGNDEDDQDFIEEEVVHSVDRTLDCHDQVATGRNFDLEAISNVSSVAHLAINAIGSIFQGTIETAAGASKRLNNTKA
jgi:hypothetical protein